MQSILIAPPAAEPVSIAEARAWLRVDTNDEDAAIASLISAARTLVESATRRALVTQGWRLTLDAWPANGGEESWSILATRPGRAPCEIVIPVAPVQSVSAVRLYDAAGQPLMLEPASYRIVGAPERARLLFAAQPPHPGAAAAGIEIDLVAGYGDPPDTPAALRHAILALVSWWFDNRGDAATAGAGDLPPRAAALIAPFRRGRLA